MHIEIMHTNKTSSLAMIAIVTAIALLTAGSITTSALAVKKKTLVLSAPKVQHPQAHLANSWVV